MIYVTKPYLPDIDKFYEKIKKIWESNHLTNDGPLNKVLEKKISKLFRYRRFMFNKQLH